MAASLASRRRAWRCGGEGHGNDGFSKEEEEGVEVSAMGRRRVWRQEQGGGHDGIVGGREEGAEVGPRRSALWQRGGGRGGGDVEEGATASLVVVRRRKVWQCCGKVERWKGEACGGGDKEEGLAAAAA